MKRDKYLICYDIVEDDIRTAISSICKDYGLERIQYSVFLGMMNKTQRKEISVQFNDIIKGYNADIHIFFICTSCNSKHNIISSIIIKEDEPKPEKKVVEIDRNRGVIIF